MDTNYKNIIVTHDMKRKQREECKALKVKPKKRLMSPVTVYFLGSLADADHQNKNSKLKVESDVEFWCKAEKIIIK